MDRVAKPTHYEPLGVRTYPQAIQGWVPAHYSATTMCPLFVHLSSYLQGVLLECSRRSGLPDHPWGSNPRLEDWRWVLCYCATSLCLGRGAWGE